MNIFNLTLFLMLFISASVMAQVQNTDFSFSVSTALTLMYGNINEYVFDDKGKASELSWEMKPLLLVGTKITGIVGCFKLEGSLFYAINEDTGSIRDYDWNTSTGVMTNYSKHNIKQRGSIFSDANISYMYCLNEKYFFFPGAGIKFNNIQLTAEDGYLEYPPGSSREDVYGKGIIYEQKYLIPYFGAGVQYTEKQFNVSMSFYYSQFVRCNARDSHVKRDIDFYDEIKNGKFYNLKGDVALMITDRTSVSLNCGWTYIPLSKGSSCYIDLSTGEESQVFKNAGGIMVEYADVGLSINLYL